jgi:hypothetical protein
VVSHVDVWTGVIPLEDWKIVFEVVALAHQLQNFRKDVVSEETLQREVGLVGCADHIAVNKRIVAFFSDSLFIQTNVTTARPVPATSIAPTAPTSPSLVVSDLSVLDPLELLLSCLLLLLLSIVMPAAGCLCYYPSCSPI